MTTIEKVKPQPTGSTMSDTVAPAIGNELFVHNMRLLWRLDSDLALRIDAVADDERFELEPTRSGAWTARDQWCFRVRTWQTYGQVRRARRPPEFWDNRRSDRADSPEARCRRLQNPRSHILARRAPPHRQSAL